MTAHHSLVRQPPRRQAPGSRAIPRAAATRWERSSLQAPANGLPRGHVSRARLVRQVAPPWARVTCVLAAGGYGKTVLLQEWEQDSDALVAHLDVDESLDTPGAFWGAVAGAASPVDAQVSGWFAVAAEGAARRPAVAALGRALAGSPGLVVVLDDYHLLCEPAVHRSVRWFVEALPPGAHLVLAGRGEPPLPLARWRMAGWLAEIREPELELTTREARAMLRAVGVRSPDAHDEARLAERADRWPAALRLLAGNGNGATGADAVVALTDYVVGDLLADAPDDVRSFLLATAVLEDLTPAGCRAVSGRDDAAAVLEQLVAGNLLTRRLAGAEGRYRLHPLVRDVLRRQLAETAPDACRRAHRRAAQHFETEGDTALAMQHWLSAGRPRRALDLLVGTARDPSRRPAAGAIRPWLGRMSPTALAADPRRTVGLAAVAAADGCVVDALSLVERLSPSMRAGDPALASDVDWLTAACLALLGDTEGAVQATAATRRSWPDHVPYPPIAALWPEIPLSSALLGDWATADAQWRWGEEHGFDNSLPQCCLSGLRAALAVQHGDVAAAAPLLHPCLRALDAAPAAPLPASHLLRVAALEAAERGDLRQAERQAARARQLCEPFDANSTPAVAAAATSAEIVRRTGRPVQALKVVADTARRAEQAGGLAPGLLSLLAQVEVRCACAVEDWYRAGRAAGHITDPVARSLAQARIRVQRGDLRRAQAGLAQAGLAQVDDPDALVEQTPARAIEALVLQVATASTRSHANRALLRSIELAAEHGLVGTLVVEAPSIPHLLAVGGQDAAPLLLPVVYRQSQAHAEPMLEPLSSRERQVLRLLPTELSNSEIAGELCLSLNTVKTHLKTLYRKLAVTGRSAAVQRARSLALLPPRQEV